MANSTSPYTSDNCKFAYQLRWGVTVFWRQCVDPGTWLEPFVSAIEKDEIRLLTWRQMDPLTTQFAVSTTPPLSPQFIVQRVKGRLQYSVRDIAPKALRPHYAIRSVGTQERKVVEAYIAKQPSKHPMASQRSQEVFEELVYIDENVNLAEPQNTIHGTWWYNLHLVLVHVERWRDADRRRLIETQKSIIRLADFQRWRLSRCSILADHLHVAVGCNLDESPESVALAMMNCAANVYGAMPVFSFSAFIGTFGEYDQRAVQGEAGPTIT
jgi:REP element-mobilizing transposase RayT